MQLLNRRILGYDNGVEVLAVLQGDIPDLRVLLKYQAGEPGIHKRKTLNTILFDIDDFLVVVGKEESLDIVLFDCYLVGWVEVELELGEVWVACNDDVLEFGVFGLEGELGDGGVYEGEVGDVGR